MNPSASVRLRPVLVCFLLSIPYIVTAKLHAVPITYILVVTPPSPVSIYGGSGSLGSVSFGPSTGGAVLTFTFEGDTSNIVSFNTPVFGHEILIGTASVQLSDPVTGAVLAQGTFLPSAGIFVSVDNTGGGIGFGSFGLPPSNTGFPALIHPVYPYGIMDSTLRGPQGYDLQSNFTLTAPSASSIGGYTCYDFPPGGVSPVCGVPVALPTTAGDLVIDFSFWSQLATFTAQLHPLVEFSEFHANVDISSRGFSLDGRFTLARTSNGISPLNETVSLELGTYSVTLSPGSFKRGDDGQRVFRGLVNGVGLQINILPLGNNNYRIRARGHGVNLTGITTPLTVSLTIGDDSGTTTANLGHGHEDD